MRKIWLGMGLIALMAGMVFAGVMAWHGQPSKEPKENDMSSYYAPLSNEEANGLLYMVEEEKLARDVYITLYNETGLQVFKNIASAEIRHMNAVLSLIDKYNLTAPDTLNQVGVFQNSKLQSLYNQLVKMGNQSTVDALKVGALIEETDIEDLENWINKTDNEDIKAVYSNLMMGSENHLRAFAGQLEATGINYTAQVLPQQKVNGILNSANGHTRKRGHGMFGRKNGEWHGSHRGCDR